MKFGLKEAFVAGSVLLAPQISIAQECNDIHELREERAYWAELKFAKSSFTLDLWKHMKNSMAAKVETILIGASTYDEWNVGDRISKKFDTWGMLADGNFDSYVTTVNDMGINKFFSTVSKTGESREIGELEAESITRRCSNSQTVSVPYGNVTSTYFQIPAIKGSDIVSSAPLQRCNATVEVRNSSFTLDLLKHIRNATTKQIFDLELPIEYCTGENPLFNSGVQFQSWMMTGRFSSLKGNIKSSQVVDDPNYQIVTLKNGKKYVTPAQEKGRK